jgi:hypothetical protein
MSVAKLAAYVVAVGVIWTLGVFPAGVTATGKLSWSKPAAASWSAVTFLRRRHVTAPPGKMLGTAAAFVPQCSTSPARLKLLRRTLPVFVASREHSRSPAATAGAEKDSQQGVSDTQ